MEERSPRVRGFFNHLDDKEKGELSDFANLESVLQIALGFTNATQITFGESRTECQFAIESLYYNGK